MKNESSTMISLAALMELEEKRIREEEAEEAYKKETLRRAEEEKRETAARLEREKIERERRAAEEAALRERETQARLEAMRQAIIEQERFKATQKAKQEEDARRMEHERQMAAIRQREETRKMRRALVGLALSAAALLAGVSGLYFGKLRPEAEQRATAAAADLAAQRDAKLKAERDAEDARKQIEALQRQLIAAATPAEKAEVAQKIDKIQKKQLAPVETKKTPTKIAPAQGDCAKGDPTCGLNGY